MSKGKNTTTVILIPTYEDEAVEQLIRDLHKEYGDDFYLLAVDDGSIQNPIKEEWLKQNNVHGSIVRLSNNLGHQAAITVGIHYCVDNLVWDQLIIMDSDGEDTPASSRILLNELQQGKADIVVGSRRSRLESLKFKLFYQIYKFIFFLLVGKTISFGNFMAIKPAAAKRLVASPDTWQHVAATVLNSKIRVAKCDIDRGRRYAGETKMSFVSLVLHGLKGIMVFSDRVLIRVSIFCIIFAVLALLAMIAIATLKIIGLASPGWFSTLWGILILILFQVLTVSLISMLIAGSKKSALVNNIDYSELIEDVNTINGKSIMNELKMCKQAP